MNAKEKGAVGVLMYLDPYKNTDDLVPFGHVSMQLALLSAVLMMLLLCWLQTVAVLLQTSMPAMLYALVDVETGLLRHEGFLLSTGPPWNWRPLHPRLSFFQPHPVSSH